MALAPVRTTRHVVLLGLMGSGKTSIGERVAELLERPLLDGDVRLEARTGGRTAAEVAEARGIDVLHDLEAEIALEAVAERTPSVIGPAASVIEVDDVLAAIAPHIVVWLTAPARYLAERAVEKDHRPLLDQGDPVELFHRQLAVREPKVIPIARLIVDVSKTSADAAAARIVHLVSSEAPASSPPS